MVSEDELTLLVEIAKMYHYRNASQEDVSKQFNMSRSQISKYLSKARRLGLVEVIVHDSLKTTQKLLEEEVKRKYQLKDVVCCESKDTIVLKSNLAKTTLEYLLREMKSNTTIAVTAGTTIHEIANNYPYTYPMTNLTFVPLSGGLGKNHMDIQANIIAELFARHSGGRYLQLHAPVLMDTKEAKEVLMQQSFIKKVFDTAETAQVALMGIGNAPIYKEMSQTYLEFENTDLFIEAKNITGDVSYIFFDDQGKEVDCSWNDRVITLPTEKIRQIPTRIGVAGGANKADAIKAALSGKIINTLITDTLTAQLLL
ncbi:sugar-binding transcriptional regulator [Candidatus Enterococcus ferrettii]|uniref:Sugar-binding domain-containing protein n=1 Tax=Candidatus Enterococcus ferrettii TaxID=2815324 RepID=A0ABV0EIJ6_9ENTE|nr:sugar-binding domain-containing protein [Enterococcus sp. 665A]MBO1340468.1 sugar-binding transcriptional regulator [Enterococcus sp. 665A]